MKLRHLTIFFLLAFLLMSCAPSGMMQGPMGMRGMGKPGAPKDPTTVIDEALGVASQNLVSIEDLTLQVADKRIIFVGEYHDRYAHHLTQLKVIETLHKQGKKLAVGMEMFQRPYQQAIDDYMAGKIDEREFLIKSEYLTRWGLNYLLYKPIIDFCKDNQIPLVALNLRKEINRKVGRLGIDSLTAEEKAIIPAELDFTNEAYEQRLQKVYAMHAGGVLKGFKEFYQSQVLWDETMSETTHNYLVQNPDRQMVVIVGGGHVIYGHGIPSRTLRRGNYDQTTILCKIEPPESTTEADYFVFPQELPEPYGFKLGVFLEEEDGEVEVDKVVPGSISERFGIESDDVIKSIDGLAITSVDDLKLAIFDKKPGDTLQIVVLRERFLRSDKEVNITMQIDQPKKSPMMP